MSGLNRCEVYIVEDDLYARDALAMYCAKHKMVSVRSATSFGRVGVGAYSWPRRDGVTVTPVALVSHDDPRVIKNALTWFEANVEGVVIVVLLRHPNAANVKASIHRCTQGIVCAEEVGMTIGEIVVNCAKGEFIATAQVIPHLFAQIASTSPAKPTVVTAENPFKHVSEPIELTMRMFCAWGMSNEQISHHFGISQNTIASRIRAGYLAMDVSGRNEATHMLLTSVSGL